MSFPNMIALPYDAVNRTTTAQRHTLGKWGQTPDGRIWRYCEAGAVQIGKGLFTTVISTPTNEQTVTVAHAAGTRRVTVTAAGITKNQFRDGYLVVTAGPGAGEVHPIKANTGTGLDGAGSGLILVDFYDGDGIQVAWTTSTDVDLFVSPYSNQVVCPVDGQQLAVALNQIIAPVDTFYWGLVKGFGAVLIDNAGNAAGLELDEKRIVQSLNHAGQGFIDDAPDATAILAGYRQILGYLVTEEDVVDDEMEFCMIDLT